MFRLAFHGGPAVEVLSFQGKNPLDKWKKEGSAISKAYSKETKSSVFTLGSNSKMQLPSDEKQPLGLQQHFLVLQVFIPSTTNNLHIEIAFTDKSGVSSTAQCVSNSFLLLVETARDSALGGEGARDQPVARARARDIDPAQRVAQPEHRRVCVRGGVLPRGGLAPAGLHIAERRLQTPAYLHNALAYLR